MPSAPPHLWQVTVTWTLETTLGRLGLLLLGEGRLGQEGDPALVYQTLTLGPGLLLGTTITLPPA